jgi:hypothetical protein
MKHRKPDELTLLERFNNTLDDKWLHATRGWRKLNPLRTLAADHVDRVQKGIRVHSVHKFGAALRALRKGAI